MIYYYTEANTTTWTLNVN